MNLLSLYSELAKIKPMRRVRPTNGRFTFIDLFAGIGGFHLAFHRLGGACVYASEWNSFARKTYEANHKKNSSALFHDSRFTGDITLKENQERIPENFDLLCAGFPCQPFSQAGFKRGFEEARGTLFFEIAKIIKEKKPKAFFLENVRHLERHNNGETFAKIQSILQGLGYSFHAKIVKASDFGLPTHRPRLYMVGFREDIKDRVDFAFPKPIPLQMTMSDILKGDCPRTIGFTLRVGGSGSGIHDRRNWDSYIVNGKVRRLTVDEGKKMMGFPEDFVFPVSKSQALKQLGNSVAVNAIEAVGKELIRALDSLHEELPFPVRTPKSIRRNVMQLHRPVAV